jgi:hypothetical protein
MSTDMFESESWEIIDHYMTMIQQLNTQNQYISRTQNELYDKIIQLLRNTRSSPLPPLDRSRSSTTNSRNERYSVHHNNVPPIVPNYNNIRNAYRESVNNNGRRSYSQSNRSNTRTTSSRSGSSSRRASLRSTTPTVLIHLLVQILQHLFLKIILPFLVHLQMNQKILNQDHHYLGVFHLYLEITIL